MRKKKEINLDHATPADRLMYVRLLLRFSRIDIENKYKLPAATLKVWETGVGRLTEKGLRRCIDIYRQEGLLVSSEWILNGRGLSPRIAVDMGRYLASDLQYPNRVNKPFAVREGNDKLPMYLDDDQSAILREASFFKESYPDAVVLMINNEDMMPIYQIGDYIGGRFRYDNSINKAINRDCIVRLKTGDLIVRRLFKSTHEGHYNLACLNPVATSNVPIIFDAEIECAAPIIWHRIPNV